MGMAKNFFNLIIDNHHHFDPLLLICLSEIIQIPDLAFQRSKPRQPLQK